MSRQRYLSTIALFAVVVPFATRAADPQGRFLEINVAGEASCETYVTARDEGRRGGHLRENIYLGWVSGFLTAYNIFRPETYNIAGTTDTPSLMLRLEIYCKANPRDSFLDAVAWTLTKLYPNRAKQAPRREGE